MGCFSPRDICRVELVSLGEKFVGELRLASSSMPTSCRFQNYLMIFDRSIVVS